MKTVSIFLLIVFSGTVFAQSLPVIVVGTRDPTTIDGKQVEVLADSNHKLTWADVQLEPYRRRFRAYPTSNLNFGFSTADYWARFQLQVDGPVSVPRVLEVGFTNYTLIELYTIDTTGKVQLSRVGDGVDGRSFRQFPFYTFGLRLPPNRNQTVYLHLVSHYGQQYFPLTIWSEPSYLKANAIITLLWGGFYGILFIVLLYHAFVFAFTRERSYLLLCGYLFTYGLYECCRGYNRLPNFGDTITLDWIGTKGMVTVFPIGLIFFMVFYDYSLRLTLHFRWFRWVMIGLSVWCFYCIFLVYRVPTGQLSINQITAWQGIPVGLTMIFVSTTLWLRGERTARFYAFASIATAGGAILMMIQRAGFIGSESLLIKFGFNIGSLLEFILLTLGLADRFREERARQRAAELARVRNEARREAEHQLALERERERMSVELHNDIGNSLMSSRLMLNRLDAQMLSLSEQAVYKQLTDTMAETYDRLKDIAHGLNTQKFERNGLVNQLTKLISSLNHAGIVEFGQWISPEVDMLPVTLQATLYSFATELTQNVLRHAQAQNAHLRVTIEHASVRLSVRDDGKGVVVNDSGKGMGMRSIRELVEQLQGSFMLKSLSEGGTSATIILPLVG